MGLSAHLSEEGKCFSFGGSHPLRRNMGNQTASQRSPRTSCSITWEMEASSVALNSNKDLEALDV
eukprot:CAMPEP_0206425424 /NCGR_PEP_ID=MMETSP0324_2-20121206/3782_1 /ASSEMBLY_ACC=CAM_ASM_000836 /TAXON_ID=2866 /ORGANISM="Crypthecodinium cohnii, Strain Seligo" /LENGTH=64 /DNA_ID=CAMNT_0053890201 /DNA_START=411 /DNA_END=605 /DNA_ORIENTATION=-